MYDFSHDSREHTIKNKATAILFSHDRILLYYKVVIKNYFLDILCLYQIVDREIAGNEKSDKEWHATKDLGWLDTLVTLQFKTGCPDNTVNCQIGPSGHNLKQLIPTFVCTQGIQKSHWKYFLYIKAILQSIFVIALVLVQ